MSEPQWRRPRHVRRVFPVSCSTLLGACLGQILDCSETDIEERAYRDCKQAWVCTPRNNSHDRDAETSQAGQEEGRQEEGGKPVVEDTPAARCLSKDSDGPSGVWTPEIAVSRDSDLLRPAAKRGWPSTLYKQMYEVEADVDDAWKPMFQFTHTTTPPCQKVQSWLGDITAVPVLSGALAAPHRSEAEPSVQPRKLQRMLPRHNHTRACGFVPHLVAPIARQSQRRTHIFVPLSPSTPHARTALHSSQCFLFRPSLTWCSVPSHTFLEDVLVTASAEERRRLAVADRLWRWAMDICHSPRREETTDFQRSVL